MAFDLTPTTAQHDLARRAHELAESVIRPVAADYDQRQQFPWPVLEEAAERGFYSPLFYRDLIGDPTGLSLPMFMEELFWGCAGIGLAIVMPALALSAIGQAASPEQMLQVEKWFRDAKLHTIFEGTSEIQRLVIAHALGAADGAPPVHVDLEPSGGPLNRWFGRGTETCTRVAGAALSAKDRIPDPIMRLAMTLLRPPRK